MIDYCRASSSKKIAVLMATYNGEEHLEVQLQSILSQIMPPALILVSDDGSVDNTLKILEKFSVSTSIEVQIYHGMKRGCAENFLSLLTRVPVGIDYVAFCDQDDQWLPEKLSTGVAQLEAYDDSVAMYCSRTFECTEDLTVKRTSQNRINSVTPSFSHALVQSIAGGNTMIFNRRAHSVLSQAAREVDKITMHDWWSYQVVSGVGGKILYDLVPQILYRQHGKNLIGANSGVLAFTRRVIALLLGQSREWNDINCRSLSKIMHRLTLENRQILLKFNRCRNTSLLKRIYLFHALKLTRGGQFGAISLWWAFLLKRM